MRKEGQVFELPELGEGSASSSLSIARVQQQGGVAGNEHR